jgi:hypothetical protein
MRPKKIKERRRKTQFALVERRVGSLWAYLQIPLCAVLLICLIRLIH